MKEGMFNPFERFTHGLFEVAMGIGAVALGLHFFNKAKQGGKKKKSEAKR